MPVSAQAKAPPGAWTAAKMTQAKRHVALGLSALRRQPKRQVSQCGFFHSNSSFFKFINDDNSIYALIIFNENTIIFIMQIIIFLVAII
jgi:uncharacterized membrane protein SpoIIM required for sporulation